MTALDKKNRYVEDVLGHTYNVIENEDLCLEPPEEGLRGWVGWNHTYLYSRKKCKGITLLNALDEIRTLMARNRETPALINMVTAEYLRQRQRCGQ